MGVPIGGRKDLNILQSGDGNTNTPTGQTATQRATNYLAWKNLTGLIPQDNAIQAAIIAGQLNFGGAPGSWAVLLPAPSTIAKDSSGNVDVQTASGTYVDATGNLVENQGTSAGAVSILGGGNKMILIAAAAAIALILIIK